MPYQFIAFAGHPARREAYSSGTVTHLASSRRRLGTRFVVGDVTLHCCSDTPVQMMPGGSVLIGHVFPKPRDCGNCYGLASSLSGGELRSQLLEHYWGDYLLIQPGPERDQITILRDPSGGVPCLFSSQNGQWFVTSNISIPKSLDILKPRINWDFIAHQLAFPTHKAQQTGLSGVDDLPPGCTLTIGRDGATVSNTWNPWAFVSPEASYKTPAVASAEVCKAVSAAVAAWAETDQSAMLELSGGLDSSIIAVSMHGTGAKATLCTLKTPIPGSDERIYAEKVAARLGLPLIVVDLGFAPPGIDADTLPASSAPRIGILQYAVSQVMRQAGENAGARSFFSGAGGDAVFCYLASAAPAADALKARGLRAWMSALHDLAAMHNCTIWKAGRLSLKKLLVPPGPLPKRELDFVDPSNVAEHAEPHPWLDWPPDALPGSRERIAGLAGAQIFRDIVPRGASRYVRMPLMAQPVMEAALRTPTWMWIAGGRNRSIARDAFAGELPQEVLERQSKGTFAGYLGALYQRNRLHIRSMVLGGKLRDQDLLDVISVSRYLASDTPPKDDRYLRILFLYMVESWLQQHD